jgi:Type IV secretion system pilin
MNKLKALIASLMLATGAFLLPAVALAQNNPFNAAQNLANDVANNAGITSNRTLPQIIGQIINIILGFLGIVLLLIILYSGFLWMTAGGDSKKVAEAQARIGNAVVGLIIIVAAFAISNFVLGSLVNVTQ